MDPQSRAFREATEADSWDDDIPALVAEGGAYHEPITDVGHVVLPEDYEAADWDADRMEPKGYDEAVAALHARIDDPHAPDTEDDRYAYDGGGS